METGPEPSPRGSALVIVVPVVVGVIAVAALLGSRSDAPERRPDNDPPPRSEDGPPDPDPEDDELDDGMPADGDVQPTVIGDIEWRRVVGDETTQPEFIEFAVDGELYGTDRNGVWWRSVDGVDWTEHNREGGGAATVTAGSETWAVIRSDRDRTGLGLWDGQWFDIVDIPESTVPRVGGLRRSRSLGPVTALESRVVIAADTHLTVDWNAAYAATELPEPIGSPASDPFLEPTWDPVSGRVELRDMFATSNDPAAVVAFEPRTDPAGVIVRNVESDALVTEFDLPPEMSFEETVAAVASDQLTYSELYVADADKITAVAAPWEFGGTAGLVELDGRLLALTRSPARSGQEGTGRFGVWSSSDGVSWDPLASPLDSQPQVMASLASDGELALLVARGVDGENDQVWSTTDGASWDSLGPVPELGSPLPTDHGWVAVSGGRELLVSADGGAWQAIGAPNYAAVTATAVVEDTIFVSVSHGGTRRLWVGSVVG